MMRDKPNTPPPATTQAPPASSIFDPLLWEWLTPAFGRYMAIAGGRIAGARNDALDYINRDVREWQLRLGFRAPGSMTIRVPDAVECRKLTVKAAFNWEEAVWIEPPHRDERCYAWRADLDRRTTLPAMPAAHAETGLTPAGASPAEPASLEPPLTEPPRSPQAELVSPGAETEPVIVDPAPAASTAPPVNPGGRPTDRALVLDEAERRLKLEEAERRLKRPQQVPKTLRAFSCELHEWLKDHGEHRAAKTGEVMKAETIEGHVRLLWNAYKARR